VQFTVNNLGDGIFSITAPMEEQIYLVCGEQRALLIDTGMGIGRLKEVVDNLTDLPVSVLNTHGHPDHAGGNTEFPEAWLSPDDYEIYEGLCTEDFRLETIRKTFGLSAPEFEDALLPFTPSTRDLFDNQEFDLGGRILKTFPFRGHTKGSIVVYDSKTEALFTGDSVNGTETWLVFEYSDPLEMFYNTIIDFNKKGLKISILYPGHLPSPVDSSMLENMPLCVWNILSGEKKGEWFESNKGEGLRYRFKGARIIYNPDNIYISK